MRLEVTLCREHPDALLARLPNIFSDISMYVINLNCVNCGAPLEIAPTLEIFACSFCGSQQRVERHGGTVALQKVESAIKAVQRGTDRTAAELALPRLAKELNFAEAEMALALKQEAKRQTNAGSFRRIISTVFILISIVAAPLVVTAITSSGIIASILSLVWLAVAIGAPIYVNRKWKLPPTQGPVIQAEYGRRILIIKQHIQANRTILENLPN